MTINNNKVEFDKSKLLQIIDEESILNIPCKDALHLSITELDIDSLKLLNFSFIIEKEFSLRIDFDKVTSKTTLNELLEGMVPIGE
jgi:acyl carrier protein